MTHLLEELRCHAQTGAAEVLRRPVGEQLAVLEAATTALNLKSLFDVVNLFVDFGMVVWTVKQTRGHFSRLIHSIAHCEPSRGLWKIQQHPHHDDGEKRLELRHDVSQSF